MVWQILLCALAAAGLLLLVWAVVGTLLLPFSLGHSCMVIFVNGNERRLEQQVRAFAWLTNCGLLRSRLLLVADNTQQLDLAQHVASVYRWASCVRQEDLEETLASAE